MPGYDTINSWLPKERVKNTDLLAEIPALLKNVKEENDHETGTIKIKGSLKNYKVIVKENGVWLSGSICKYFLKDNIQTIDRKGTMEGFTILSDELHLPVYDAEVKRIDMAENFLMNYEVPYYYDFLGNARHYNRLTQNNGLYYRNGLREMLFYGKLHEQKQKGMVIPEMFSGKNMLRYEYRLQSRLCNQLNRPEIITKDLWQESFYMNFQNRWKDEYFKIYKYNLSTLQLNFKNMKTFEKQMWLIAINSIGGEAAFLQMIEQAKQRGEFTNKMQVKRYKDKLKSVCSTPLLTYEGDAIAELDKKIKEAVKYHR